MRERNWVSGWRVKESEEGKRRRSKGQEKDKIEEAGKITLKIMVKIK